MRLAGKISTALLLMVYIAAFAGFRLHECSVDHTVQILSVMADDACQEVHHHHCSDEGHCGHHHHHCPEEHAAAPEAGGVQIAEADCCANSLHVLTDAQLASDGDVDEVAVKGLQEATAPIYANAAEPASTLFASAFCTPVSTVPGRIVLVLYSVRRV